MLCELNRAGSKTSGTSVDEHLLSGSQLRFFYQRLPCGQTLEKSLRVLKPGGKIISVAGPPDPDFAKDFGANWFLIQAMRVLSLKIRRKAKRRGVTYSFLFMKANGDQLRELGSLIDAGAIRPVVDRVFPFQSTTEALAYVEKGRAKGKVVVKVR